MQIRENGRVLSRCLVALAIVGCGASDAAPPETTGTVSQSESLGSSFWTDGDTPARLIKSTTKYELGLKFTSVADGNVTAIRFYKGPTNTGSHTGNLWSGTGTLLATADFTDETPSGWQTATLPMPVTITAGTNYVVSYYTASGYAFDSEYFATERDVPPLHAPIGAGVYRGGGSGFPSATYRNGNYWVDLVWSAPVPTEFSFWTDTDTPAQLLKSTTKYELGLKFSSDANGSITAIKFYKGPTNTGPHTGHVWSGTGTLLATVDFTDETASGWQTAPLSTPVATTAGAPYVVSYYTASGYAYSSQYFATGRDVPPLHAPIAAGVYRGGGSGFPTAVNNNANYWVDLDWTCVPTCSGVTCGDPDGCGGTCCAGSGCTGGAVCGECEELVEDSCAGTCVTVADATACTGGMCISGTCVAGLSTIFGVSSSPTNTSGGAPVELGVKFTSDVAGQVTSLRFYRPAGVTGQTGHLWSPSGTLLGSLTFPDGTTAGWQQAAFGDPIAIDAGETYMVSYHGPGKFAYTPNYFTTALDAPPLHAQAQNGFYKYAAAPTLPTVASSGLFNYWVDVVFQSQ